MVISKKEKRAFIEKLRNSFSKSPEGFTPTVWSGKNHAIVGTLFGFGKWDFLDSSDDSDESRFLTKA